MNRLMADVSEIDRILRRGADKANEIASANLADIKDIIGLLRP
jgi:tryptophanyl-tRNA synthetase